MEQAKSKTKGSKEVNEGCCTGQDDSAMMVWQQKKE
jgi:hypothetical protein